MTLQILKNIMLFQIASQIAEQMFKKCTKCALSRIIVNNRGVIRPKRDGYPSVLGGRVEQRAVSLVMNVC